MSFASLSVGNKGLASVAKSQARVVVVKATDRPLWMPGSKSPEWLDGSLPGDYGFDPIGLGSDPEILKYFVQAELVHARFAMLGAAGIVIPGLLTNAGALNVPAWYEAGQVSIEQGAIPFSALLTVQILLMGWVEGMRIQDFKKPGSQGEGAFMGVTDGLKGKANGYPGGFFDPMGMAKNEAGFKSAQQKEIKNGRLAMLATVGFVAQHQATGKNPMENLFEHIANPTAINFATNGVSIPHPPTL